MITIKRPLLAAIAVSLLCTVLTAVGSAAAQISEANELTSYLMMSCSVAISVVIGLLLMRKSASLAQFGLRAPQRSKLIPILIPLLVLEMIPLAVYGFHFTKSPAIYAALALFTIVVGLNEELYFRGLVVGYLSTKSRNAVILGSSILFGVLHAMNALNNKNIGLVILQICFAFLVGLVLVQIVILTKSIWIGIAWHTVHNFLSFATEEVFDSKAMLVVSLQVVILALFALFLFKALPNREHMENLISPSSNITTVR